MTTSEFRNYGSFQDSLKSPIHRWFTYPAGYSHKLIEAKIAENRLTCSSWIADPFLGTGTTSVVAKTLGINSLGVEAHPFVYRVALTKLQFSYNLEALFNDAQEILSAAKYMKDIHVNGTWPDLVYKCFSGENLKRLLALRTAIWQCKTDPANLDFLRLALTATLRIVTTAGAGWPYIAPSKYAERTVQRNAFTEFEKQCNLMISDVRYIQSLCIPSSTHKLINGDARQLSTYAGPESIDLILTSPPYLNNYDYADRTRLETYFWGIYHSWGDITREVRDHLIIAATTQIRLNVLNGIRQCPKVQEVSPDIHRELVAIIEQLAALRQTKAGKKTYDYMVAGYFEDMLRVLQEAYAVLKPGSQFILVLGDSAPYGVHVPTDEFIGRLALAVGFGKYGIEVIRTRGEKWAHNTQRHKMPLRESVLTIQK